jgi:hypothetical protein
VTTGTMGQLTTLRIVRVPIRTGAPRLVRVSRVVEVDILQTSGASLVTRLRANCNSILVVPVNDNVVSPSDRQIVKESLKILGSVEGDRLAGVDGRDLVHVEDLDVVANGFRADDGEVVENTDLAPGRAERVLSWQTSEVGEFALFVDFDECRAGVLSWNPLAMTNMWLRGSCADLPINAIWRPLGPTQPQTDEPLLLG